MKLAPLFTDNMVLQQGQPVPVWGTAEKGETVTVRFADQEANTQADAEGRWEVRLQLMSASSEPRTLTVESQNVAVAFSNVLVGEVWVCSGQSNRRSPPPNSLMCGSLPYPNGP